MKHSMKICYNTMAYFSDLKALLISFYLYDKGSDKSTKRQRSKGSGSSAGRGVAVKRAKDALFTTPVIIIF